jgi:hypothetical protein
MAHYAELNNDNIVIRVLVISDENDSEEWCEQEFGGRWKKTSFNTVNGVHVAGGTPLRHTFAGIGYIYDEEKDVFIKPKPYPSWTLNNETLNWEPPIEYPEDSAEGWWNWNESTQSWDLIE